MYCLVLETLVSQTFHTNFSLTFRSFIPFCSYLPVLFSQLGPFIVSHLCGKFVLRSLSPLFSHLLHPKPFSLSRTPEEHFIVAWSLERLHQTKAWEAVRICRTKEERDIPVERYSMCKYIAVRDSMANFGNNSPLAPSLESELAWTLVTIACTLSLVKGFLL